MTNKNVGIVILAAGASTRFGSPKQLAEIEGKTLIELVCNTAVSTGISTIVVLGAHHNEIEDKIESLPVKAVLNEDWKTGLSSSIKTGLDKLLELEPNLFAVILLLCDQPSITSQTLEKLLTRQPETGKSIIASRYSNTAGTPAMFTRKMFAELLNLKGDRGAKSLIKKYLETDVELVDAPEAAFDIDSEDDHARLTGA